MKNISDFTIEGISNGYTIWLGDASNSAGDLRQQASAGKNSFYEQIKNGKKIFSYIVAEGLGTFDDMVDHVGRPAYFSVSLATPESSDIQLDDVKDLLKNKGTEIIVKQKHADSILGKNRKQTIDSNYIKQSIEERNPLRESTTKQLIESLERITGKKVSLKK